jgi:hypothetical protein
MIRQVTGWSSQMLYVMDVVNEFGQCVISYGGSIGSSGSGS